MCYTFQFDPLICFGSAPANISGWGNGTLHGIVYIS